MEEREGQVFTSTPSDPPPPTTVSAVIVSHVEGLSAGDSSGKKRRGRPRKYDAEGNLNPAYKSPTPRSLSSGPKKRREKGGGDGFGSCNISSSLGELVGTTAGSDFTPHVAIVQAGEDVVAKIISLSQMAPRGVCVLSANGSVSNVTIRQPGSSGGLLTYEGRFEILSLKGSFTVSESAGMNSRMGGLSVSLASPDGRVLGGGLAGLLIAASPIQMVVASFTQHGLTNNAPKRQKSYQPRKTHLTPVRANTVIPATPISETAPSLNKYPIPSTQVPLESFGEALNHQAYKNYGEEQNKAYNNFGEAHNDAHDSKMYNEAHNDDDDDKYMSDKPNTNSSSDSGEWNISDPNSVQRSYPDINVSLIVD